MRNLIKTLLLLLMLSFSHAAIAGDVEDGLAAAKKGDFATALRLWKPLAEQGNARAQNNLGFMYANGDGVAQDYVKALTWWNIAAIDGVADAIKNRDIVAKNIPPAQIEKAQEAANRCIKQNFKNCD